jgi:two-component sensor histidine kinase
MTSQLRIICISVKYPVAHWIVCLVFVLNTFVALGQNSSLSLIEKFSKLSNTDQRCDFLVDSNITKMDKANYLAILTLIEEKRDDKAAFYWHYKYLYFANHFKDLSTEKYQETLAKMTKIAERRGYKVELIVTRYQTAINEVSEQKIYSSHLNCFEQIKRLGVKQFKRYAPDMILHEIGRNFHELGDNEKALECLLLAEHETMEYSSPHFQTMILNLIESIYADSKDYLKAIVYAQKVYDLNLNSSYNSIQSWYPVFWQGLSSLNIAQYMLEMGNLKEGEKYADRGYKLYVSQEDFNNIEKVDAAFDALQVLIKIKLRLGKLKEVEPLFQRVEFLKPRIESKMESFYFKPLKLYENYVLYYEAKKDYTKAFRYSKLANELQDSLDRRNDKRKLWQIESRVKSESYLSQIKLAEEDSRLQQQLRNMAILAMLLIAISAFVVYRRFKKDNKIITKQKSLLELSLGEKENLLKEIHHRVKNNLQIISGLFDKQARNTTDEMTKKLLLEGQNRVFSIALVHQNLYQTDHLSTIDIKPYIETLIKNIEKSQALDTQRIAFEVKVDDSSVDIDTAIPLGLILNELITNCYKYAFIGKLEGLISIVFHQQDNGYFLKVKDNGVGIDKHIDINDTKTLGLNLVRGLVRQLDGLFDFQVSPEGTIFTIYFKN